MNLRKKLLAAASGGLLLAGGLVSGLPAAHAASGDTITCSGEGAAHISAPIPAAGGVVNGTYTFTGPITCTVASDEGTSDTTTSEQTIVSQGSYENTGSCGTGWADGSASVTVGSESYSIDYYISFTDGAGTFTVENPGNDPDSSTEADTDSSTDSDGGTLSGTAGSVDITPSNPGGCATAPVTGFNVVYNVDGSSSA
jgi:hypothetical protein